jgi:hypothetical protein
MKTWASMAVGAAIGAAVVLGATRAHFLSWTYRVDKGAAMMGDVETKRNRWTGETWKRDVGAITWYEVLHGEPPYRRRQAATP